MCEQAGVSPISATDGDVARVASDLAARLAGLNGDPSGPRAGPVHAELCHRLASARLFYDFLITRGLRHSNPVSPGYAPRLVALPWIPAEPQRRDILAAFTEESVRNRAMFALAYDAALGPGELCSLQAPDVSHARRLVHVRALGAQRGRVRMIPYSATTENLLSDYLAFRPMGSQARGPLFLAEARRDPACHLSARAWSDVVRRVAVRSGVSRFSASTIRHLRLADLARAGLEPSLIATFAGHSSIDTARAYIRLSELS